MYYACMADDPLDCYCASLRHAARVVTQIYDQMLRPAGVTTAQFTVLRVLSRMPAIRVGELAELLGIEQSAMTRTLALMRQSGWIEEGAGGSARETRHVLTDAGQTRLAEAEPLWTTAQKRLVRSLGREHANSLRTLAVDLTRKLQE